MSQLTRRQFVQGGTAAVAAGYFVNPVLGQEKDSPNERLNIAAVGTDARAGADIRGVASQNIVALADVDRNSLDKAKTRYTGARTYTDFRRMLEKEERNIDAVVVGTPDHSHAPAAAMALRMKKHVYCEKPLTHTVYEARTLANLAKENKLVTQMGTQIHALDNYRRVVEMVQSGLIGKVREVHVWASATYTGGKFVKAPQPTHLDWDLWLGPAPERPYCKDIHPFHWRRFWDYGTGALGDFGCHFMDLAHWALDLHHPTHIAATGPAYNPVTPPAWMIVKYSYPARGEMPPVKLTWYDSGKKPKRLDDLKDAGGKSVAGKWGGGQLFVGETGVILSNYSKRELYRDNKVATYKAPEQTIPASIGHHREWVEAIKKGGATTCNFDYSGALTEAVLLGTVSYRAGQAIDWDAKKLKVTNAPAAQKFVHKEYRKGWKL